MDDEFYLRRRHVPAFGSWDDESEFTECFEYRCSEDRDLYVAGDLYDNDVVTSAVIVVPRRQGKGGYPMEKEVKKDAAGWVVWDVESESPPRRVAPKAVDEDLYKISPALFPPHPQPKRKIRAWGFFSSCLRPTGVC